MTPELKQSLKTTIAAASITAWAGAVMFSSLDLSALNLLVLVAAFAQRDASFFPPAA